MLCAKSGVVHFRICKTFLIQFVKFVHSIVQNILYTS